MAKRMDRYSGNEEPKSSSRVDKNQNLYDNYLENAKFTEYTLNSLGVDCETLNSLGGYLENSLGGHAFNVVKINGKSYFLDNTWIVGSIQKGLISSLSDILLLSFVCLNMFFQVSKILFFLFVHLLYYL